MGTARLEFEVGHRFPGSHLSYCEDIEPWRQKTGKNAGALFRRVLCLCDCGRFAAVQLTHARSGLTKSCGHGHRERSREWARTLNLCHGDATDNGRHYLYTTWASMRDRCRDLSNPYYGQRGIVVCDEWVNDYPAFKAWILENLGERPEGHSLDRVNPDGNYEPSNLRWASAKAQQANRRDRRSTQAA
jgi:hypothetical protein